MRRGCPIQARKDQVRVGRGRSDPQQAVRRFKNYRRQFERQFDFEVTNAFVLSVLLDVFDLHLEREGRLVSDRRQPEVEVTAD